MGLALWTRLMLDRSWKALEALFADIEDDSLLEDDPVGEFLERKKHGALQLEDEEVQEVTQEPTESKVIRVEGKDIEELEPGLADLEQSSDEREVGMEDAGPEPFDEDKDGAARLEDDAEMAALGTDELFDTVEGETGEVEAVLDDAHVALEGKAENVEVAEAADEDLGIFRAESPGAEMAVSEDIEPQALETDGQEVEATESIEDDLDADGEKQHKFEVSGSPEGEETQGDEEIDSLLEVFKSEPLTENPISALSQELGDTNIYSLLEETKHIAKKMRKSS